METELKALQGVEIKDATEGRVQAVFATFNSKDFDGDVTLPGAFEDGAKVRISAYGHASWGPSRGGSFVPMPPVGKGVIRASETEAILDGQFFLKTQGGADTFELVKEMGDLQEWSYGYDVLESDKGDFKGEEVRFLRKQKVHEVSPVLLGAGIGTRTVAIKQHDMTFPEESEYVLGAVRGLFDRVEGWGSGEGSKAGRQLSSANRDRIQTVMRSMHELMAEMEQMLADNDPQKSVKQLWQEFLRYEQLRASLP